MTASNQPYFSVVIPSYNKEDYITACLDSVTNQTFDDIEIIIVDDGSTDNTLEIIHEYACKDTRIQVISLSVNQGRHIARSYGVKESSGRFILFLDADDSLEETTCEVLSSYISERPDTDILNYGLSLTITDEIDEVRAASLVLAELLNTSFGTLEGDDIIFSSFNPPHTAWIPWNVIASVFRGDLVRNAFSSLEHIRLNKLEDAYEYLAIALQAQKLYSFTEFKGYKYFFGRGISGKSKISAKRFISDQIQAHAVDNAIQRYARSQSHPRALEAAHNFHNRALLIVGDDFVQRLTHAEHKEALAAMQSTWGKVGAYQALYQHIYGHIELAAASGQIPPHKRYYHWQSIFYTVSHPVKSLPPEYEEVRHKTQKLIDTIDELTHLHEQQVLEREEHERARLEYEESIRIFKTGTLMRRIFDKLCPLGTHRRDIARRLAKFALHR